VNHPSEWPFCGYHEVQNPRQRYSIIDHESLIDLFDTRSMDELKRAYRGWVEEALERQSYCKREARWTESIAVGSEAFVRETKEKLGIKAIGREVLEGNGSYELREPEIPYDAKIDLEKEDLRLDNTLDWEISD